MVGFFFLLPTNALALTIPWILRHTINQVQKGITQEKLFLCLVLMIVIALAQGLIRMVSRIIIYTAGRNAEFDIRNDFYGHLLKLPPSFYHRYRIGDLMSRAINDTSEIRMFLGPGFLQVTNTCIAYISTIVLLCLIDVKLTLIALLPYPVLIAVVRNSCKSLHEKTKRVQEQLSRLSSKAQENFNNIHVIHSYVQEANEERDFKRLNQGYFKRNMRVARLRAQIWPLIRFISGCAPLIILWIGTYKVIGKQITLGDFVAFNTYLAMLVNPTIAFGWILSVLEKGYASMNRINEILNKKESHSLPASPQINELQGGIRVKNLSFSYPTEENHSNKLILKNIHFELKPGQTLGILGRTGSGKTTLIELLSRFYPVPDGTIFYDQIDANRIPVETIRSSMGVVPQTSFLFSTTVKDNILFGQAPQYDSDMFANGKISLMDKEITAMPFEYETVIGEKGLNLSGGQRQRMALARALSVSPKIIILDDAFSSVDVHTEEQILKNLKDAVNGKTLILISHRISTLKDADWILVMDEGEIVEEGTHIELIKKNGVYSSLFRIQRELWKPKTITKEELDKEYESKIH